MLPNDFPPLEKWGTSGNGRKVVFGRGFMKSYVRKFENRPEGIKNPVQGLFQSVKTTEKGAQRLWCRQNNKGKKAPYSG